MAKTAKDSVDRPRRSFRRKAHQARRFGKTRSAQSTALLEDYVELIADLLPGRRRSAADRHRPASRRFTPRSRRLRVSSAPGSRPRGPIAAY